MSNVVPSVINLICVACITAVYHELVILSFLFYHKVVVEEGHGNSLSNIFIVIFDAYNLVSLKNSL